MQILSSFTHPQVVANSHSSIKCICCTVKKFSRMLRKSEYTEGKIVSE